MGICPSDQALELLGGGAEQWFPSSEALAEELAARPVSSAVVLVKGSRGIQMEKVLDRL